MKVKTVKLAKNNAHKKNSSKNPNEKKEKKNPVVGKKVKRADGVTEYLVKKIMSDTAIKSRVGTYFPESHYSLILRENADVYSVDDNGKKELLVVEK